MTEAERKLLFALAGWAARLEEGLQTPDGPKSSVAAEIRRLLPLIETGDGPEDGAVDSRLARLERDVRWLVAEVKSQ